MYKNGFLYCWPSQALGAMILTNLNLHYIQKLSCILKNLSFSDQVVLEKKINLNYPTLFL
jgi:hypothetical protein